MVIDQTFRQLSEAMGIHLSHRVRC
jgi:hypothetical protein